MLFVITLEKIAEIILYIFLGDQFISVINGQKDLIKKCLTSTGGRL